MSNEYNNRDDMSAWGPTPEQNRGYPNQQPYPQQPPYGQYGNGYGYPNPYGYNPYGAPPAVMMQKASVGQRIISWLIDGLITSAIVFIPIIFFAFVAVLFEDGGTRYRSAREDASALLVLFGFFVSFVLVLVYYVISIGRGQTAGNKVAGMRFVDANGAPPGNGKAFIRLLTQYFVSGWFFFGYLWMFWDLEQQTLHDKIAGTYGVTNNPYPNNPY